MAAVIEGVAARRGSLTGFVPPDLMGTVKAVGARSHLFLVPSRAAGRDLTLTMAEGFVALPGGFEGMADLLATLACNRSDGTARPIVGANLGGYFDPVAGWLDQAVSYGLMTARDRDLIQVADSTETVLRQLGVGPDAPPQSEVTHANHRRPYARECDR
jgi:predicted Rossmann-fold nucleotide-binding protein